MQVPFLLRHECGHTLKNALSHELQFLGTAEAEEKEGLALRLRSEAAGGALGGSVHHVKQELLASWQANLLPFTLKLSLRAGYLLGATRPTAPAR
jgi:hypothetical protein